MQLQLPYRNRDSEVVFTIDTTDPEAMKLIVVDVIAIEGDLTIQLQNGEDIVSVTTYPIGTHHIEMDPPTVDAYISGRGDVRVAHSIAWPTPINGLSKLVE